MSVLIGVDGNFFRLPHIKVKTKVREMVIRGPLFADDAVLCASSTEQLREFLDCFSLSCKVFGLAIGLKKTVVMSQSAQPHTFKVDTIR